jgi:hypothetical protein
VNSTILEAFHTFPYFYLVRDNVKPTLGGQLLPLLGYKARVIRTQSLGIRHHCGRNCHFQVEFCPDLPAQELYIAFLDVTTVLPQVNRYAVGARFFCEQGSLHGIGNIDAPGLSNRGYVINVDAEANHP